MIHTYKLLTEGVNEFIVNIPSDKLYHAVDIAGSYSGRVCLPVNLYSFLKK